MSEVKIEIEKPTETKKENPPEPKKVELKEVTIESPPVSPRKEPEISPENKQEDPDEDLPLIDQKTLILTIIFTIIRVIVTVCNIN